MARNPVFYESLNPSEPAPELKEHIRRRPWQPGFFKRLPWLGVLSIVLALGCAGAAVGIAIESDDEPLDRWQVNGYDIQPAVLLSIVATVGNALLVYAFTRGATVHWWNTALDPKGTTLSELHSSYHYGSGLTAIFGNVHAINAVAIAGIFMPILLMDTPFFQRSVSIVQTTNFGRTNATIAMSPSPFLYGATGILPDHAPLPGLYHPLFATILQQYTNREPILFPNGTCLGTCHLEVVAPGWDIDCTETTEPYRLATQQEAEVYYENTNENGTLLNNSTYNGPRLEQTVFDVDVLYNYTLAPWLSYYAGVEFGVHVNVKRKSTPGGNGTMALHSCKLMDAIVRYPLILTNSTVSLGPMPLGVNRTVQRVYREPETSMIGQVPSTLGGFWLALHNAFQTQATIKPVAEYYRVDNANPISSQYLRAPNASDLQSVNVYFNDPMADLILMANELAFRTAYTTTTTMPASLQGPNPYNLTSPQSYVYSPNLTLIDRPLQQRSELSSVTPLTVYQTHRGWVAGGAVLMFIAAILISCTYWGFWKLGRPVSMSPLEIARAFDAPIMRNTDPNATGQDLKKALGSERIYPRRFADAGSPTTAEKFASSESLT